MNQRWNVGVGLDRAAADDERVGVERVDHLVEEEPERVRLHAEDVAAHRVAALGQSANPLRRRRAVETSQLVIRIACQEIRQECSPDRRERAERLEIAGASAVALRHEPLDRLDALVGDQHVPELAAEAAPALDDVAFDDDAAAETGADNRGDRGRGACSRRRS